VAIAFGSLFVPDLLAYPIIFFGVITLIDMSDGTKRDLKIRKIWILYNNKIGEIK